MPALSVAAAEASRQADAALDALSLAAPRSAPQDGVPDALARLCAAVSTSRSAAELAKQRCAASLLRRWLSDEDSNVLEAAVRCVAALAAPDTRQQRTFQFGEHQLLLRDASLCDAGLGWRVWSGATRLCDVLAAADAAGSSFVRGRRVVELGAGVGLCGLLAARLGAAHVVLTDVGAALLETLEENAILNNLSHAVSIRSLDWGSCGDDTPHADTVLGSDVIYDTSHATLLPGIIATLLPPSGFALLCNGIRFPAVLYEFIARLPAHGLCGAARVVNGCDASDDDASLTLRDPPLGLLFLCLWAAGEERPAALSIDRWLDAQDVVLVPHAHVAER